MALTAASYAPRFRSIIIVAVVPSEELAGTSFNFHATCLLVSRVIGVEKIEAEVTADEKPFRRKKIFNFMIRYLCPVFAAIILVSSVANALGWISM